MPCNREHCVCSTPMARQTCPEWEPSRTHRLQRCMAWQDFRQPCELPTKTNGKSTCLECPYYQGPKQGTPVGSRLLNITRRPDESSKDYRQRYQREYQRRYRRFMRELRG